MRRTMRNATEVNVRLDAEDGHLTWRFTITAEGLVKNNHRPAARLGSLVCESELGCSEANSQLPALWERVQR